MVTQIGLNDLNRKNILKNDGAQGYLSFEFTKLELQNSAFHL